MPTWVTQISHWVHTTLLSLHGLSVVSLVLVIAVVVALWLLSGVLRVVVEVAQVAVGGYLLLHVLNVA